MDKSEQLEVSQADRDAAANIWRDYVARVGECIAEKAIREGASDCTMIVQAFARHRQATEARMAAAVEALNGYQAAVAFVAADAWDGCPDCIDILKAARCADTVESLTPDEIAANLKRIRPHYQPQSGASPMDKSEQLEVSQADRDAAANIWRDYVARVGECIAEKAIREGASDCTMIVQAFARHRQATEARMAAAVEALEDSKRAVQAFLDMVNVMQRVQALPIPAILETAQHNCPIILQNIDQALAAIRSVTNG